MGQPLIFTVSATADRSGRCDLPRCSSSSAAVCGLSPSRPTLSKLCVDFLTLCDEVFDAGDLSVDIQGNHLLSSAVKRLNMPPMRCHGSAARWSSVVAFRSGSTGGEV